MSNTSETTQTNPLREGLATRAVPQACTVVIFGATGDLTMRKLIPALYNIAADGELPPALDGGRFRAAAEDGRGISQRAGRGDAEVFPANGARRNLERLRPIDFLSQSEFHDDAGYKSLAERLEKIDKERGTGGNRLFYLAVAPDQFEPILKNLKEAGLNKAREGRLGAGHRRETVRHRSRLGARN